MTSLLLKIVIYVMFLELFKVCLTQNITFSLANESQDRFVFAGETNIDIVCNINGYNGETSLIETLILFKGDVIYNGSNILSPNKYSIQSNGLSTTLTIKMADTNGTFICRVINTDGSLNVSGAFGFIAYTTYPQCWKENHAVLQVGEPFVAECFFIPMEQQWEVNAIWKKNGPNGEEKVNSVREITKENVKYKQIIQIDQVSLNDNDTVYICQLMYPQTSIGSIFLIEHLCEIGPLIVNYPPTQPPEHQATKIEMDIETSIRIEMDIETSIRTSMSTSETGKPLTTLYSKQLKTPSPGLNIIIYIIAAGVISVLLIIILLLIILCCCCCRKEEDKERDNKLDDSDSEQTYHIDNPLDIYDIVQSGPVYDSAPRNSTFIESADMAASQKTTDNFPILINGVQKNRNTLIHGPELLTTYL